MKKKLISLSAIAVLFISCGESDQNNEDTDSQGSQKELTTAENEISEDDSAIESDELVSDDRNCEVSLYAYLSDPDNGETNVRSTPGGDVILKLSPDDEFELTIIDSENGWFKVSTIFSFNEGEDLELSSGPGWIHGSVIGLSTRNYGGEELKIYAQDSEISEIVTTIKEEKFVRPKSVCGDWVEIEFDQNGAKKRGWIQKDWLCGSAVTNCS